MEYHYSIFGYTYKFITCDDGYVYVFGPINFNMIPDENRKVIFSKPLPKDTKQSIEYIVTQEKFF